MQQIATLIRYNLMFLQSPTPRDKLYQNIRQRQVNKLKQKIRNAYRDLEKSRAIRNSNDLKVKNQKKKDQQCYFCINVGSISQLANTQPQLIQRFQNSARKTCSKHFEQFINIQVSMWVNNPSLYSQFYEVQDISKWGFSEFKTNIFLLAQLLIFIQQCNSVQLKKCIIKPKIISELFNGNLEYALYELQAEKNSNEGMHHTFQGEECRLILHLIKQCKKGLLVSEICHQKILNEFLETDQIEAKQLGLNVLLFILKKIYQRQHHELLYCPPSSYIISSISQSILCRHNYSQKNFHAETLDLSISIVEVYLELLLRGDLPSQKSNFYEIYQWVQNILNRPQSIYIIKQFHQNQLLRLLEKLNFRMESFTLEHHMETQ